MANRPTLQYLYTAHLKGDIQIINFVITKVILLIYKM